MAATWERAEREREPKEPAEWTFGKNVNSLHTHNTPETVLPPAGDQISCALRVLPSFRAPSRAQPLHRWAAAAGWRGTSAVMASDRADGQKYAALVRQKIASLPASERLDKVLHICVEAGVLHEQQVEVALFSPIKAVIIVTAVGFACIDGSEFGATVWTFVAITRGNRGFGGVSSNIFCRKSRIGKCGHLALGLG